MRTAHPGSGRVSTIDQHMSESPYTKRGLSGWLALAGYIATILGANWAIGHLGTCYPEGPCTIPVGFGLAAPSGVLFVGLALFLRDLVQDQLGRRWTVVGIIAGAILSYLIEQPFLALASGVAFLLSEGADFVVYTPLREAGKQAVAVFASGLVGSLIDSAVFLWLAFGSLDFLAGQFIGKTEITVLCTLIVFLWRRRAASESYQRLAPDEPRA
jgi:queuosine precursor transporter